MASHSTCTTAFRFIALMVCIIALSDCVSAVAVAETNNALTAEEMLLSNPLKLNADATAQIGGSLFDKITAQLVPVINALATKITIPGMSEKHFSFSSFKLSQFHIGDVTISFVSPNQVAIVVNDFQLAVPQTHFDVFTWVIVKITCGGNFWASLGSTTITVNLDISTDVSTGNLVFTPAGSNVQFGNLDIQHHLDSFLCRVGEDIIQLFIGNLNNVIKNVVEKDIPAKIGGAVSDALNKAFTRIPFQFVGQPAISGDAIAVTVDLIRSQQLMARHRAAHHGKAGKAGKGAVGAMSPHDIELFIQQGSLDSLILWFQSRGRLNKNITLPADKFNTTALEKVLPAAYQLCPGCPLGLQFLFVDAPQITLTTQAVTATTTTTVLGLTAVNSANQPLPLVEFALNITAGVLDLGVVPGANGTSAVLFHLNISSFQMSLYQSSIGPVDVQLLGPVIAFILENLVVPAFNKDFAGIPLPAILNDVVIDITAGTFALGVDIALPPV